MNSLLSLLDKPSVPARQFKSSFGVSEEEFKKILSSFAPIWRQKKEEALAARWINKQRKNKPGSGLKSKLPTAAACLGFVLYYLKQYPTFDAFGAQFNMSGGRANQLFHYHRQTLSEALNEMGVLPKTSFEDVATFRAFVKANGLSEILVDATERSIQRPQDEQRQKEHYSGKKKAYS